MKLIRSLIIVATILIYPSISISQVVFEPNFALKSPETLNLVSYEIGINSTTINMSIMNLADGGYFCADKNTYIITDSGVRYRLSDLIGIPTCPEVYRFDKVGERLYFTLIFPAIDPKTGWFDIVEECGDMCFSVLGVTTSETINSRIDECFNLLEAGNSAEAARMFELILPDLEKVNHSLTGSVYLNLITIYNSLGDSRESIYSKKLINSSVPYKQKFIDGLNRK
jgi:hypothetical protein